MRVTTPGLNRPLPECRGLTKQHHHLIDRARDLSADRRALVRRVCWRVALCCSWCLPRVLVSQLSRGFSWLEEWAGPDTLRRGKAPTQRPDNREVGVPSPRTCSRDPARVEGLRSGAPSPRQEEQVYGTLEATQWVRASIYRRPPGRPLIGGRPRGEGKAPPL